MKWMNMLVVFKYFVTIHIKEITSYSRKLQASALPICQSVNCSPSRQVGLWCFPRRLVLLCDYLLGGGAAA